MSNLNQKPLIGAYLILLNDNKILLSKPSNPNLKGLYSLVAGHTEVGETVFEAVIREAKEEINLDLNINDLEVVAVVQRPQASYKNYKEDIIDFFIMAHKFDISQIKNNEPDKCDDLGFYDIDNLPNNIFPHVVQVINSIKNKQSYLFTVEK